jgi:predicted secreted hydrolase
MRGERWMFGVLVALAITLAGGVVFLLSSPRDGRRAEGARASLSAVGALAGGAVEGFARAEDPRPFVFPDDHGPHPDYRTEWWYLTGNLESEAGDPFGFQLTFFRNSLTPEPVGRDSPWDSRELWMGHFALTDVARDRHQADERFARGAAGMAGGAVAPFRVWLGDWELSAEPDTPQDSAFPMRLRAGQEGSRLDLRLLPQKPVVLQGERGLSQKGPERGNASYYLSWTRIEATGTIEWGGQTFPVKGTAWMDREWSTSALSEAQVGWDWFALQLDDGRDLMFFELRRADGTRDPLNHGTLVGPTGETTPLGTDDFDLEVIGTWRSPLDGTLYPSGWRIRIPSEGLDLEIQPRVQNQEMDLSFRYWEGAVAVQGTSEGVPVGGVGYVELTGYGERPTGP